MTESQVDELKQAQEKLTNSAQELFTKLYEQSAQAAGDAAGGDAGADTSTDHNDDDDIVDGDYEEV